jgi:FkbM family methyltransferase
MTQPVPFGMIVPSIYGPVIVSRYDTNQTDALIKTGRSISHDEITALCAFIRSAPEGAVCLDVGANFGLYALAFARELAPRNGSVHAFEAQRLLAYMMAGTAVLNGVENLIVHPQAVGSESGRIPVPQFDYNKIASFGSIEFGKDQKEFIGQPRLQAPEKQEFVDLVRLDDLHFRNVHLLKIDVEGMEEAAVAGASQLIERDRPVLCMEWIKSEEQSLVGFCKKRGYRVFKWGMNLLCVHRDRFATYSVTIEVPEL